MRSTLRLLAAPLLAAALPAGGLEAIASCPSPFAVYLGPGNDAQNRTWYFRDFGEARGMRLSAIPSSVSTFTFTPITAPSMGTNASSPDVVVGTIALSDRPELVLNAFPDSNYIDPISAAWEVANPGSGAVPVNVTLDAADGCSLAFDAFGNQFLQRYGFNVLLTPETVADGQGQIQWGKKAWAVEPPAVEEELRTARVLEAGVRCEEAYYLEPCGGDE